MKFSDNLRNLRVSRNMTQMDLAKSLNTSQSAITAWERSAREPDFRTIQKIADFFGVPMSTLLPQDDTIDEDYTNSIANSLHKNPKLRTLFDKVKFLSDADLDVVISVVNAIQRNHEDEN